MSRIKLFLCLTLIVAMSFAAINEKMTYQGKLTDSDGIGINDVLDLEFRIYDVPTAGTELWSESHTGVTIEKGLFSVVLGETTPIALDFDGTYYLEIVVDGDAMTPRSEITAEGYAFRAKYADEIAGGLTLDAVLTGGNSTEGTAIVDDSDDIVEIDDALEISDGHRLMVDAIAPEGSDTKIDFGGNIDLNGNYINNSDGSSYDGRVAFNDNIVPVNPAQDIGAALHPWDDIFLGGNSRINIDGDEGTDGDVLSITSSGMEWQPATSMSADDDWTIGTGIVYNETDEVAIGTNTSDGHGLNVEHYEYGYAAVRGADESWTVFAEGMLGVLDYSGLPGDFYNVGILGIKHADGDAGVAVHAWNQDDNTENYALYAVSDGTPTMGTNYGIYATAANAPTNYAAYFEGNIAVTGTIEDSDGDVGASGEVLSSTGTGTDWIAAGSGAGQWEDGGNYKNVIGNTQVRAYETGHNIGFEYRGQNEGTVDSAGVFRTDWESGVTVEKIGVFAIGDAYMSSDAYGVKAIGRNYSGGGTGGNKYGVYGAAQWGAENYGVYGTNIGTSGNQYAIYGDMADGEYAGYFDGKVGITGELEDSDGDVGTAGQVLSSTATGTQWIDAPSGSGSPAGSDGYMQYNDGGTFGGADTVFWDDATNKMGIGTASPTHTLTVSNTTDSETMRLIGSEGSYGYGARLNFGDGDLVYIEEPTDDDLKLHASNLILEIGGSTGSEGQVLTSNGTEAHWENLPWQTESGRVYNTSDDIGIGIAIPICGLDVRKDFIGLAGTDGGYNATTFADYGGLVLSADHGSGHPTRADFVATGMESGNYGSVIRFFTRDYGATPSAKMTISEPGNVSITGNLTVSGSISKGGGSFLIDHPDDPENKTLRHNFVESPENLCVYRGEVELDESGEAKVEMPDYYKSLVDESGATVHPTPVGRPFMVGYEWEQDRLSFVLYGDPGRKVSYIIYADRDDPVIHHIERPVVEEKPDQEKGYLINPDAYGYPKEKGYNFIEYQTDTPGVNGN
ncbi:MAG: hypothetical protein ACLFSQ_07670 [Candidatus Zixiibacteriota bacterium]